MSQFNGKNVVVMGLGRFGGGIGVAQWLSDQGADVLVTDLSPEKDLKESVAALSNRRIRFRLGGHETDDLKKCDLLVVSPAVDKSRSDFFHAAQTIGVPWTSEMTLFLERCPGLVVGITGTVGKSTTTAMVGTILECAATSPGWQHGRVWLGGNIGKSLLSELFSMRPRDVVVLELSSFQLEDIDRIGRSPNISLVTNIRDNHLDRHGTLEAYAHAKGNIYKYQIEGDWIILPYENGIEWLPKEWEKRSRTCRFGVNASARCVELRFQDRGREEFVAIQCETSVPGMHNLQNAAGAMAIAQILGVPQTVSTEALKSFSGLSHRLEFVREYNRVKYYNDSKATTPEAAMTSLQAFEQPVIALVGGSDKGSDFSALGRILTEKMKAVVCMGATREKICAAIEAASSESRRGVQIKKADDFESAVDAARSLSSPGDVVVLSPACASYDWFKNYEERGETFKRIVNTWR